MRSILLLTILLVSLSFSASENKAYFCNNGSTKVYHLDKDCRGIKRCTQAVKEVSRKEAIEEYKLRLCGYED